MSMFPIYTTGTLTAPSGTVTFFNIPQTFTHLQARLFIRSTAATNFDYLAGFLNIDGASNYSRHGLNSNGATASSNNTLNAGVWAVDSVVAANNDTANVYTSVIVDILDYRNTNKFRTLKSLAGFDANGTGTIWLTSNQYRSTVAVTSISFFMAGNFATGSRIDLYGIDASSATGV